MNSAMNKRILLAVTAVLVLSFLTASAFAQAAAESVLLNGSSSATTVKAGSKLGSALNQSASQLAGRVPQGPQPSRGVAPGRVQAVSKHSSTSPGQGPVIASIQGGSTHCASSAKADGKAPLGSAQANCNAQGLGNKSTGQGYKPVITVTIQK